MAKESVASLVKKELGIQVAKISEEDKAAGKTSVGDISMEKIVNIVKARKDFLLTKDFKSAVKQIVGSVSSMTGVLIENRRPKEILKEIDEGKWDNLLK